MLVSLLLAFVAELAQGLCPDSIFPTFYITIKILMKQKGRNSEKTAC